MLKSICSSVSHSAGETAGRRSLALALCSDLTEATLTGASLSMVASVIMVILLFMVRRFPARLPASLPCTPQTFFDYLLALGQRG